MENPENYLTKRTKKGIYDDLTGFLKKNYRKGKKALDIGSGLGIFSKYAKELGYKTNSCDIDPEYCKFKNIKIDICNLNNEKLPYKNNSFDVVFCTEVIEHVENPGLLISEISRVAKKGGKIYLSTPNLLCLKNKIWFLFFSYFISHPNDPKFGDHVTHMPPKFIEVFFQRYNINKVNTFYLNSYLPFTKVKLPNHSVFADTVAFTGTKK